MKLKIENVEQLAHLSRLEFDEAEKKQMMADMDRILSFVEKINELDLEDVEPLVYMSEETNVMREDKVELQSGRDDILKNAPDRDTDYIRVPKVVRDDQE